MNVQLAVVDGDVFVLEANPRASRTVPFASKAIGVNLVEAACRLMAGARRRRISPCRAAGSAARAAGPCPSKRRFFRSQRFPGSDPVLGPEMRSTGEVMAFAHDFPSAFAKAERAAGRPLPVEGTAFLSVRDADKRALVPVARDARRPRLPPRRDERHGRSARSRRDRGRAVATRCPTPTDGSRPSST